MAGEVKLKATLPNGKVIERRTAREYTHVVAVESKKKEGEGTYWWALRWSQGRKNAQAGVKEAHRYAEVYRAVSVQVVEVVDPRKES